jgi:ribosome-binding protein aMBF1 (putative translation factor)
MPSSKPTRSATDILRRRLYANSPSRQARLEQVRADAQVGREIHRLRKSAGLSQKELARLIGTTESVISRLEDADYTGHSMNMLHRIAVALHKRVVVKFVEATPPRPRKTA